MCPGERRRTMTVQFHPARASVVVLEDRAVAMSLIDPIGALGLGKQRHQERLRAAEMSRLAKLAQYARAGIPVAETLAGRLIAALSMVRRDRDVKPAAAEAAGLAETK